MNILMTANAAWNIWNFRRPVVAALLADGHRITVLAPRDGSVPDLEAMGCRFLPLEMSVTGVNPLQDFQLLRRFRRIFRAERPDVVLGYTIKNNVFGAIAASAQGIAFIPNVTGLGTAFLSGSALQTVAEALYRKAFAPLACVYFQNPDDRDHFLARQLVRPGQARLLPGSGIDLDRFAAAAYPPETAAPVFLMIGRLLRDKGIMEYVETARAVRATHPRVRFRLLGAVDAAHRGAIGADTVRQWQAEDTIDYLGTADDVRPHIAAAHCVVLPSYREGAPRTLIEAAAMGRPVIATDVPGCRSVIDDGVSGLLCAPRDSDSLAAACRRFIALPQAEKVNMGLAGRSKMEAEFDQSIVIEAYRAALGAARPVRTGARAAR